MKDKLDLDSTIKSLEDKEKTFRLFHFDSSCVESANECSQIIEWLKELKELRDKYSILYDNECTITGTVTVNSTKICPKCNKMFKCIESDQIEGFRNKSDCDCPYCGHILESSMFWKYSTSYGSDY